MQYRLIHCLVVILIGLQSLTAMSATPLPFDDAHCGGQTSMGASQADCCNDDCAMPDSCVAGCAVFYSAIFLPTTSPTIVSGLSAGKSVVFLAQAVLSPEYTPLNPPPIA